jgi:hypothetical protein
MNDYFSGQLAHQRQADYLREVQRDEARSELRRTQAEARQAMTSTPASAGFARPRRVWRLDLGGFMSRRLLGFGYRP